MAEIGVFALAQQRLGWIDARQRQLAQNIANADTPNFKPRDIVPFASMLDHPAMAPVLTNPLHMVSATHNTRFALQRTSQRAPDGNQVDVEDQLTKVADDENTQALVGNLWKSYLGMFMTALGRNG